MLCRGLVVGLGTETRATFPCLHTVGRAPLTSRLGPTKVFFIPVWWGYGGLLSYWIGLCCGVCYGM